MERSQIHAMNRLAGISLIAVSGYPLLAQAAMNAVQQWKYQPTLLNGEPVAVEMKVTVTFSLGS
jgi:protein TonB